SKKLNPGDFGDKEMDPYTGFGFTASGDRLPGGKVTLNQELKADYRVVPPGAKVFQRLPDGTDVHVATYVIKDGVPCWEVSADCPEHLKPKFTELTQKGYEHSKSTKK